MSVYRTKGSSTYAYDFRLGGRRFHGPTGCRSRRDAEAVERARKEEARRLVEADRGTTRPMTLDEACGKYWLEVGQHHAAPDKTAAALTWLIDHFGRDKLITDIANADVAAMVATRRSQSRINRAAERGAERRRPPMPTTSQAPKLVAPATVNRSATEPLRKVLNRARDVWGQPIQKITWRTHLLKEPQERVRSLSEEDEEPRLFAALSPTHHHPLIRFALRTGCRLSECVGLRWSAIDWGTRTIMVLGKGAKLAPIPMTVEIRDMLWALRGRHPERVFSWRPEPTEADPDPAWRPMSLSGVDSALGRAMRKAGITDFRFHDLRHTTATRLLRRTGNLRMVQRLLRHEDIQTTARYAHVLDDDLRAAMDEMTQGPEKVPRKRAKPLTNKA